MIVIDTNVISEMMKATPSQTVASWFDKQETTELFITTITVAEISYGLQVLPDSKRKDQLKKAFKKILEKAFQYRILAFDGSAALAYGNIMAKRKSLGRPMSILDGQIAAIATAYEFSIATRNIRDFSDCDITIVNPFEK